MERTEIEFGRWRVKRIDSMNWQVFQLREVKANHNAKRAGETDWMACPAYFGKLEYALEWCLDREADDMGRRELKDAVRQLRAIKSEFLRELKGALA